MTEHDAIHPPDRIGSKMITLNVHVTADDVSRPECPVALATSRASDDPNCLIYSDDYCRVGGLYGLLPPEAAENVRRRASGLTVLPFDFSLELEHA